MSLGTGTTPQRNANSEMTDIWNPKTTKGYLDYQTGATQNASDALLGSAKTALSLYPELQSTTNSGNTSARTATLGDLQTLGSGYTGAMTTASPLLGAAQSKLTGMVDTADQPSELSQTLTTQALDNLKLGSDLSNEQVRDSTQATRSGLAARGMVMGNNAIGTEILNRDSYGQRLLSQRQNTALSVESQNQAAKQAAENFVLNANGAGQTLANSSLGLLTGINGVNVNSTANFVNPSSALSSSTSGANSILGYTQDVNSSNYNALIDAQRTNANNNAALWGSIIGTAGKIGGSYLGGLAGAATPNSSLGIYQSLRTDGGDGRP